MISYVFLEEKNEIFEESNVTLRRIRAKLKSVDSSLLERSANAILGGTIDSLSVAFPLLQSEKQKFIFSKLLVQLSSRERAEFCVTKISVEPDIYLCMLIDHLYVLAESDPSVWMLVWDIPFRLIWGTDSISVDTDHFQISEAQCDKCEEALVSLEPKIVVDHETLKRAKTATWQVLEMFEYLIKATSNAEQRYDIPRDINFLNKLNLI